MNITVVSRLFPTPQNSNSGIFVLQQAKALSNRGHEVRVVSPRPYVPKTISRFVNEPSSSSIPYTCEYGGITVHYPRYWSLPRTETLPLIVYSFRKALQNHIELIESSDIINAHVALPSGFGSIPIARELGIPLVTTIHGADLQQYIHNQIMKHQIKKVFEKSENIILNSSKLRQICAEEFEETYNTTIVHNGIEIDKINDSEPIENKEESFKIISVGRLVRTKGHRYVLEAISQIEFDCTYLIVGSGPQKSYLEEYANKLGIRNQVSFIGQVNHKNVFFYLKSADVFVLPSYNEAFGIAYIEAMACGLPTVACEGEGPEDFISDRETGFLVPPRNSLAIAQLIQELYHDPKLGKYVAGRGQQTVFNAFSWDRNAMAVEAIFDEAIKKYR